MTREEREIADHIASAVVRGLRHVVNDAVHHGIGELIVRQYQAKIAPEIAVRDALWSYVQARLLGRNIYMSPADTEEIVDGVQRHIADLPVAAAFESALEGYNRTARGEGMGD